MAIPRFESSLHKPADADESVREAYRALVGFKQSFDAMEEIPSYLRPAYKQLNVAIDALFEAGQETHQLRMVMRRAIGR